MVLEKTLESPLDCKEIQPVHPKVNQSEYSLEGLMLKLKLQFFGHLMQRTNSLEKTLLLGKIEGGRRERQRMRWLDGITELGGHEFGQAPGVGDVIQPSDPLVSPLLPPSIIPKIRVFSNELVLCIRWPKYWNFSFSISPSNEYSD